MHLADGIVESPAILGGAMLASAAGVALCVRAIDSQDTRRGLAWTGTLAAFVLAVQALNVPLFPGVSAHAIGAGLLTLLLGPSRAILALTAVLVLQALLFADGGLVALGINVLNIGILPVVCLTAVRRLLGEARLGLTAIVGTLLGNVLGAASLAAMLVVGAGAAPAWTFGMLVGVQAVSGLIEGALTAAAVTRVSRRAPALLTKPSVKSATPVIARTALAWAVLSIGVAVLLLPFASSAPDALEVVLERSHSSP